MLNLCNAKFVQSFNLAERGYNGLEIIGIENCTLYLVTKQDAKKGLR